MALTQMKAVQSSATPNFFDLYRKSARGWGYIASVKERDFPRPDIDCESCEVFYLTGKPAFLPRKKKFGFDRNDRNDRDDRDDRDERPSREDRRERRSRD